MSVRLSCPSCNTAFALDALPPDRRAACPRCGDVFPVRGEVAESEGGGQKAEDRRQKPGDGDQRAALPNVRSGWSIRRTVVFALALGSVGLAAGLAVHYSRGSKPPPEPQPEPPLTVTATPPARLVGLGYLPAECNVLFAVQPGPVLAYAALTKQEPRELLTRSGVPQQVFAALDQIGLSLAQIDHITGGVFAYDEGGELRVALALVLKQPLADEDAFLQKLKAQPAANKKTRFTVQLEALPFSPRLARVSPTVWVFGLNDGDLAAVDRGGFGPGGTQFRGSASEGVRAMLAAVPPEAAFWIVADDDRDWTQKPLLKMAAQADAKKPVPGPSKWLPAVPGGRGGLFALTFGEAPRMRLFVRTAETATADRVRTYFRARAAERESASAGGGGVFAMFDAPLDPALLQRFLTDAAK